MRKLLSPFYIFALVITFLCSNEKDDLIPTDPDKSKKGRVGIRELAGGLKEFYDKSTQETFTPMGYNYTHVKEFTWNGQTLTNHSTFNEGLYNHEEAELMLSKLQEAGYNVVRVFLNPVSLADVNGNLDEGYLANVANFLKKAGSHDIGVIITTDMIPLTSYGTDLQSESDIWWWNHQYLFEEQIALETNFWKTFISYLKTAQVSLETVFAYAIRNEFFFHPDHAPLNQNTGLVEHINDVTYDMGSVAEKDALMEDGFLYWSSSVRSAIHEEDPEALVTVGFYAPEPIGKPSLVAVEKSELDFIDLHMYPENATASEYADYFSLASNINKLVLLGEFGIVEDKASSIHAKKDRLIDWKDTFTNEYGVDGWLLWAWNTGEGMELSVDDESDVIFNAFAPN